MMETLHAITALRISLASPEQIRVCSAGEVTNAETINYRTEQPVAGGLFCQRIFGPTRDWTCACGHVHRKPAEQKRCKTCGVEYTEALVRRERMGHIELAAPVAHPWYVRNSGPIGLLLDLSPRQLASVLAYQQFLLISVDEQARNHLLAQVSQKDSLTTQLARMQPGDLLDRESAQALLQHYGKVVQVGTGAQAVRDLLEALDLEGLARQLWQQLATSTIHQKYLLRRLHTVQAFRASGMNPAWMILTVLPVLPPELRPVVPVEGGRLAASDANRLYERVIHRNNRLKQFLEQGAPEVLLTHEKRLLQQACNALLDNAHSRHPFMGPHQQPLKSLAALLEGKQGHFRRHLLGKRVDYSGRSVIVVGPEFHLDECGLPKEMACELFKPFVMRKLLDRHMASSPRTAKRLVERRDPRIWDLLEEVLYERVVLLNRAPTLHRLSIQAFVPRLIEGKAIQLPPLVCSAFNADFDGDQMAVHLPLSEQAQQEAGRLLLATRHLRHPASGEPVVTPSQEMVLGCFYLTEERTDPPKAPTVYADPDEAKLAYEAGHLDLHMPIVLRIADQQIFDAPPPAPARFPRRGRILTTVGRVLFNEILPAQLRYRNYPMTKEALKHLVAECLATCGESATAQLVDEIKRLGFHYATRSGTSLSLSEIKLPRERAQWIERGQERAKELDALYHRGELTEEERDRQMIALWTEVTERISEHLQEVLEPHGSLMTIIKSGATKARFQQIRQLSGIRGLMANPAGKIMPLPVLSNYKLGLRTWEVFIAASGARKGFMDRSLNTATSGYLTRRLVEVGMQVWITQADCGTTDGLLITHEESQHVGLPDMRPRVIGRILAERVGDLESGTLLSEEQVDRLVAAGCAQLRVRSPLTCQASVGICQRCYGVDLATGRLVRPGAAVGIIAGQSIGEPGTQLTMRTFHSGGIANAVGDITAGLPRINELFEARRPKRAALLARASGQVSRIETDPQTGGHRLRIRREEGEEQDYDIPQGTPLTVQEGAFVEVGTPLVEGPLDPKEVLRARGREAVQRYLINEVQHVYRATGVFIHDKHLEVIVRQLLRWVVVAYPGDSGLLPGQPIDQATYLQRIAETIAQGGEPALARPMLLGLTRATLQTNSWVAAASFQETSRVLVQAAIRGQIDPLVGWKERLALGISLPT